MEMINALGRRKSAIARIYVTEGTGKITINKRDLADYFPSPILAVCCKSSPLALLDVAEKYDIKVNLCGGGFTGQSQLFVWLSLVLSLKSTLTTRKLSRAEGFMTRDPRAVERKKARSAQSTSPLPVQQALILQFAAQFAA